MPLPISSGAPTLFVRRAAYEKAGIVRASIDERLGLTADEFRVEGDLVAIGPTTPTRSRPSSEISSAWGSPTSTTTSS